MTALAPREGPVLSAEDRRQSVASIRALQLPSGMIPWAAGQGADPWNHLEATMALACAGEREAVERALCWYAGIQRRDRAVHAGYSPTGAVADTRLDTNGAAYLAVALRLVREAFGDDEMVQDLLPVALRGLSFVCAQQRPGGEVCWSDAPPGGVGDISLVAACSSIYASLHAAADLAAALGCEEPVELACTAERLRIALTWRPGAFADKHHYAMDWYYPVLAGVLDGAAARHRLEASWDIFVQSGRGVLCRSDSRWVTAAETAECALACVRAGLDDEATVLLSWTAAPRQPDGSYLTGLVWPERSSFPTGEATTYSTAAVLLAADALAGGPARRAFSSDPLR